MLCAAVRDQDQTFIYSFSLDELGREVVKGPYALRVAAPVLCLFSVYDQIIVATSRKLLVYGLTGELLELPTPSPVLCYLPYSDQCTRILLGTDKALHWLHVKDKAKQVTPATTVPLQFEDLLMLGSTNTGIVTIVLYSRETKSLVLRINLKSQEIAKVCEINTEKTELLDTFSQGNLTFGRVKQGNTQEIRLWSKCVQVLSTNSVVLEAADRVFAVEGDLWLLSSQQNSLSALYHLTKTCFQRSTAIPFLESESTLFLFTANSTHYQVSPSSIQICGLRGANKCVSFPFQVNTAAGFISLSGDFQVLISSKDRLYRGKDGKFVAETTSPIQAIEGMGGRLYVLCEHQKVEILRERQGNWEWERTWEAWGTIGMLNIGENLLFIGFNCIEIRKSDFSLQTYIPIPPCQVRKLSNSSLFLHSEAISALLDLNSLTILPFGDPILDAAISDSTIIVVDKAGMRAGERTINVKERVVAGELAGLSQDALAVLEKGKISLFPLPFTGDSNLSVAISTSDAITSILATHSEVLIVLNRLTLQLHSLSPAPSLLAHLSFPCPVLSVLSLVEGWLVVTFYEVWFLSPDLEEFGPRVHFETEMYQKLRMAQDQECVQELLGLGLAEKYEALQGVGVACPSGLPEKAEAVKVVITLTDLFVYISSWSQGAVTTKTQIVSCTYRN